MHLEPRRREVYMTQVCSGDKRTWVFVSNRCNRSNKRTYVLRCNGLIPGRSSHTGPIQSITAFTDDVFHGRSNFLHTKLFYSWRGGSWWVLKAKFPRRAGTYCENHRNWNASSVLSLGGGFGNNAVFIQRNQRSEVGRGRRRGRVGKTNPSFMKIFNKTSFMSKLWEN